MEKFNAFMEEKFVPVAAKIGSAKILVAIRDAFISMMPVTMAGAFAVMLNAFFRDLPGQWGWTKFVEIMQPVIAVNGNVWWGTLAMFTLVFVISLGYQIAKAYDVNAIGGALVAIASYIALLPQAHAGNWGGLSWGYLNTASVFSGMIITLISTLLYVLLIKKKIVIKMPESVPPAVSNSFMAIIPGLVAIYVCGLAGFLFGKLNPDFLATYPSIVDFINNIVQKPLMALSQSLVSVLLLVFFVHLFWFFGLHGTNMLGPVINSIYLPALTANSDYYKLQSEAGTFVAKNLPNLWVSGSFDAFVYFGGAGVTLALMIALFLFAKKDQDRALAKMATPMAAFNINEPVMFGMPIVLNPIYFIPFMLAPLVLTLVAYGATALGIIPPVYIMVTWVMPPVLSAIIATGGNLIAGLIALINLAIAVIIYIPFVIMANKIED